MCFERSLCIFFCCCLLTRLIRTSATTQPRLSWHRINLLCSAVFFLLPRSLQVMFFFARVLEKLHNIPKAAGTTRDVSKLIGVPLLIFQFFIVINAMQFAYILYSQLFSDILHSYLVRQVFALCVFIRNSSYLTSANSWHKKLWTVIAVRSSVLATWGYLKSQIYKTRKGNKRNSRNLINFNDQSQRLRDSLLPFLQEGKKIGLSLFCVS